MEARGGAKIIKFPPIPSCLRKSVVFHLGKGRQYAPFIQHYPTLWDAPTFSALWSAPPAVQPSLP